MSAHVQIDFFFRTGRDCSLNCRRRSRESLLSPPLSGRISSAFIDDNLIQPAAEMLGILTATQPSERPHESRLQCIVGIHSRAEHANGEPRARILMPTHQAGKRLDVAIEDGGNKLRVRRACHKSKTPGGSTGVTTKSGNAFPPFPPQLPLRD